MSLWLGALLLLVFVVAVPSTLHASRVTARLTRVGETGEGMLPGAQDTRVGTATRIVGTVGQPAPGIVAVSPGGAPTAAPNEMRMGIWYRADFSTQPVGVGEVGAVLHTTLGPGRPNPFRGSTRLGMTLPRRDRALLQVFDVSGREVGTLVDEELDGGLYEIHLQAGSLSPGLYFVRLRTSQGAVSRKILHLD